eukprot:249713-Pleurochrysis_carterae.AAC.1
MRFSVCVPNESWNSAQSERASSARSTAAAGAVVVGASGYPGTPATYPESAVASGGSTPVRPSLLRHVRARLSTTTPCSLTRKA